MFAFVIISIFVFGPVVVVSQVLENDTISERIIGGTTAEKGQFPYQVSIRFSGIHNCGGSIISQLWILTAGHCVYEYDINLLLVIVGTNQVKIGTPYGVVQAFTHELFHKPSLTNDIALIRVARPIQFSNIVKPIQLTSFAQPVGTPCVLSGWGWVNEQTQQVPDLLQYLGMNIVNLDQCRVSIKNTVDMEVRDTNVCAFNAPGRAGCHADSGGPLVCNGVQYGIVSFGWPCAKGVPDVFTNVYAYRRWITMKTGV